MAACSPSYRDVAVDDEQMVSGNVKLAAQLVGFPVEDPEALVVRIKNGLQKLQLGLQSRNRHLPLLISGGRENGERDGQKKKSCALAIFSVCVFVDVNAEIKLLMQRTRL